MKPQVKLLHSLDLFVQLYMNGNDRVSGTKTFQRKGGGFIFLQGLFHLLYTIHTPSPFTIWSRCNQYESNLYLLFYPNERFRYSCPPLR